MAEKNSLALGWGDTDWKPTRAALEGNPSLQAHSRRASFSLQQMDWQSAAWFFTVTTPRVAKHMLYGGKIRTFKRIKNVYLYAFKNISLYNKGSTFSSHSLLKSTHISISLLACGETRRCAGEGEEGEGKGGKRKRNSI